MKVYALVDCNNFYVSCERVFNPSLKNKAVAVLSNNDGCIVARSQEVKDLGIGMGAAFFEYEQLLRKHNVQIFSSNYALYGDMSARVMRVLMNHVADVEIYSIDEAFLHITHTGDDTVAFMQHLRTQIKKWTGIPVCIGIGPTKTLAKLANKTAKKNKQYDGVYDCTRIKDKNSWLAQFPVEDVWGIGRQYTKKLNDYRIRTAYDFIQMDDTWIRNKMTINGLKTAWELRGTSCIALHEQPDPKQSIAFTRSFKHPMRTKIGMQQALSSFVARAAEELREQKLLASAVHVFIATGRFSQEQHYANAQTIELSISSAYTPDLITAVEKAIDALFIPGYLYKRAGIILVDLVDQNSQQQSVDHQVTNKTSKNAMMKMIDSINAKWGRQTIAYAAEGNMQRWRTTQLKRSPRYTTSWHEILKIRC